MPDRPQPPGWLKSALDLGPVLLFLLGYSLLRERSFEIGGRDYDGFIVVTGLFIPVLIASNYALYRLVGRVSRIQIFTLIMVVVFGALTVWLNDERFFKMKSTIVFGLMATLLFAGLARGRSGLEYVLDGVIALRHRGWMILTRRMAWFLTGLALLNEVIWRTQSTDVYVLFDTFGQMGAIFIFLMTQGRLLEAHMIEDTASGGGGESE